jgi:hypothetical protein
MTTICHITLALVVSLPQRRLFHKFAKWGRFRYSCAIRCGVRMTLLAEDDGIGDAISTIPAFVVDPKGRSSGTTSHLVPPFLFAIPTVLLHFSATSSIPGARKAQ